jgi:hypothetical protein
MEIIERAVAGIGHWLGLGSHQMEIPTFWARPGGPEAVALVYGVVGAGKWANPRLAFPTWSSQLRRQLTGVVFLSAAFEWPLENTLALLAVLGNATGG